MRAVAVLLDDEIAGIVGVVREREFGKFFSDYKPELHGHLGSITVWRGIMKAMQFVKEYKGPVIAVSEHGEGAFMLTRLGFTHGKGECFIWLP